MQRQEKLRVTQGAAKIVRDQLKPKLIGELDEQSDRNQINNRLETNSDSKRTASENVKELNDNREKRNEIPDNLNEESRKSDELKEHCKSEEVPQENADQSEKSREDGDAGAAVEAKPEFENQQQPVETEATSAISTEQSICELLICAEKSNGESDTSDHVNDQDLSWKKDLLTNQNYTISEENESICLRWPDISSKQWLIVEQCLQSVLCEKANLNRTVVGLLESDDHMNLSDVASNLNDLRSDQSESQFEERCIVERSLQKTDKSEQKSVTDLSKQRNGCVNSEAVEKELYELQSSKKRLTRFRRVQMRKRVRLKIKASE